MARKTLSILLALCMVLSLMPFGAFAANNAAAEASKTADSATYVPAYQIVSGGKYLITTGDSGSVNALNGSSSSVSATAVDVAADGSITVDDSALVWNAEMSSDVLALKNSSSGRYLSVQNYGSTILRTSSSAYGSWFFGYYQLQRQGSSSTYTVYFDNGNFTVTTNSTDARLYLFVEEGTADPGTPPTPPPTPTPELEAGTYVVVANGNALTANHAEGYAQGGTPDYQYHGLSGVPFTEGETTVTYKMVWTVEAVDGGFTFSNDGKYLSATYESLTNGATSDLVVSDVVDVWSLSNHQLHSANCDKYLYHAPTENIFSVRSASSAATLTFIAVEPVAPCTHDDVDIVGAVAATCTEDGYTGDLACTACGEVFEAGEVIPALGHDWSGWTVTTPAGEYTPGEETRTCSRCDAEETREIEPLHVPTYVQVDRLVDGVEYLIVSTNQDGSAYVLTNPGATSAGASMGATEVTIADGKITGYHDGTLWLATANGERFDLTNEGGYLEGKGGNIKIYSTQQYPNRSWAYSDSYLEHLGGNYTYEVYHNGTSFTYAQYSAGTAPSHPVYLFALEGAVLPCQHENLTAHAAKAATCTENGNDAYWECEDCHKLFSDAAAQTEIEEPVVHAALGHNWGEWTLVTAAGATTPGSEKRVCSRCGEEETRATDPTGVLEPGTYVIVIGGNAITTVRSANSAQGGTSEYQYTGMDGVPYVDGETEATAAMIWTVEAVDGGYVIRSGENYLRGTYSGTVGDLAVSDQSDVWTIDSTRLKSTNASAGNSGKFLGYVIDKDLFTMRSYRPESPDANLQMDVIFYPVEAFVCDHASTETRGAAEATCTEDGYTGDVYCTVCGEKIADGEAIPALGHDYEAVVTAPTCTEQGYTTHTCTRCEDAYVDSYVDALGHAWDDGVVTQPATCTEDGIMTFTCTRDASHTRTEVIAAAGHDYEAVVTAPTCTEAGYTTYTCSRCGDSYIGDQVDALGHDTELRNVRAATCTEDGYTGDVYCTVCGEKIADGEAIPALGHSWDEGVVTQQPTGSAEGVKTFTCTRCGEKRTEPIPKLVNPFVDVFEGRYYYNAVLWAFYRDPQITDGVDDTHFMPDRICTRAHVVTFLWRANGCPEPNSMTSKLKDVQDPSKYYYKAVLWAAEQGITTGYDDGTFRPDAECTRGQVVTFLWRANGSPKPVSAANPFTDVSPSAYNYDAILWAYENGITDGKTPTTFAPTDACTRGHVVTFLYRSMT